MFGDIRMRILSFKETVYENLCTRYQVISKDFYWVPGGVFIKSRDEDLTSSSIAVHPPNTLP